MQFIFKKNSGICSQLFIIFQKSGFTYMTSHFWEREGTSPEYDRVSFFIWRFGYFGHFCVTCDVKNTGEWYDDIYEQALRAYDTFTLN